MDHEPVRVPVPLAVPSSAPPPIDWLSVTVKVRLERVDGRKLTFSVSADDGVDTISEGIHERFVIDAAKFNAKVSEKGT